MGKFLTVACLLTLVLGAVQARKSKSPDTQLCLNKNPFIRSLSAQGIFSVEVYSKPRFTKFAHCQDEWDLHGSCCNQDDLLMAYRADDALISETVKHFDSLYDSLNESVTGGLEQPLDEQDKAALRGIQALIQTTNFSNITDTCWDFMKNVRGSALCSTCSGRSQLYFSEDKILVSPRTCQKAADSCEAFFDSLHRFYEAAGAVIKMHDDARYERFRAAFRTEQLKVLVTAFALPTELVQAFRDYSAIECEKVLQKKVKAAEICSMMLNVNKAPYIVVGSQEVIDQIKDDVTQILQRKLTENLNDVKNISKWEQSKIENWVNRLKRQEEKRKRERIKKVNQDPGLTAEAKQKKIEQIEQKYQEDQKAAIEPDLPITKVHEELAGRLSRHFQGRFDSLKKNAKQIDRISVSNWKIGKPRALGSSMKFPKKFNKNASCTIKPEADVSFSFNSDSSVLMKFGWDDQVSDFVAGMPGITMEDRFSPLIPVNLTIQMP